ncbi:GNAT family N-acetyltransferase [Paenibacillus sp. IB182493]|uniref:GNAT family N-acetyltransferase n=2 Tax=Paenibacillus arenilitoris TaxID=2772299 RepID=A0A927CM93_9BACL|nr:GNAT family N-acetyltransferase [Paenibacillus arenilitoris]
MEAGDVPDIHESLDRNGIPKPMAYIARCWEENKTGKRVTLAAFVNGGFAGWLHLLAKSYYPDFAEKGIPEINNFDVIPPMRRRGIGSALMDAAEKIAFETYGIVGIGVGLYASYGSAQRIYARRGYIPDGRGITYNNEVVEPGSTVRVDDELVLYMTKNPG